MTVIIDYEAGNIGSIKNMLKKLGYDAKITSSKHEVEAADRIILPGVGSFDFGVTKLKELGLAEVLNRKKAAGTPILGICLGAQLMCESSEEGKLPGLGWIKGHVKKFPTQKEGIKYTVPHMGWDVIRVAKPSRAFEDIAEPARFYFVHSYFIHCDDPKDVLTENSYSTEYHSAFEKDNIIGVQYHPEKSHKFGKQLLKNFMQKY
jgi:imidazole glycerol-phosphate synthase subunit HisH